MVEWERISSYHAFFIYRCSKVRSCHKVERALKLQQSTEKWLFADQAGGAIVLFQVSPHTPVYQVCTMPMLPARVHTGPGDGRLSAGTPQTTGLLGAWSRNLFLSVVLDTH